MGVQRKTWLKEVVRIEGLYIVLVGEGEGKKVTYKKIHGF